MITNHELEAVINETAQDIAQVEEDPVNCYVRVMHLFDEFEHRAAAPRGLSDHQ